LAEQPDFPIDVYLVNIYNYKQEMVLRFLKGFAAGSRAGGEGEG
jgi:hypothetical protein